MDKGAIKGSRSSQLTPSLGIRFKREEKRLQQRKNPRERRRRIMVMLIIVVVVVSIISSDTRLRPRESHTRVLTPGGRPKGEAPVHLARQVEPPICSWNYWPRGVCQLGDRHTSGISLSSIVVIVLQFWFTRRRCGVRIERAGQGRTLVDATLRRRRFQASRFLMES